MNWNHIILEGFCTRKLTCEKQKYFYELISTTPWKTKKIENKCYNPNYKTPRKPRYCKNRVSNHCWEKDCPHLGLSTVDEDEYKFFLKKFDEEYEYKENYDDGC